MKTNLPYQFSRLRRLVEIPPAFAGGDPALKINVALRPEVALPARRARYARCTIKAGSIPVSEP